MSSEEKREYLAVYDYGTGGVWLRIKARSPMEIADRVPQLTVYPHGERPEWMTAAEEDEYTRNMRFDLDAPDGLLANSLGANGSARARASSHLP
jgi:hypothetical protein